MILEIVEVDSQFPTNAGVYERQQCSGNEQKVDSPLIGGRTKPPHISQDATTENDQGSVAVHVQRCHSSPDGNAGVAAFVFLNRGGRAERLGRYLRRSARLARCV